MDNSQKACLLTCKLFFLFHQIILVISDLQAGCLQIQRVVSQTRTSSFDQFQSFLQVLETYGTGYNEDIDTRLYKLRDNESHRVSAVKQLQKIQRVFELALIQLEDMESYDLSKIHEKYSKLNSKTLRQQLKILFQFQKFWFEQLEIIQKMINKVPDEGEDFVNLTQGHLVKMTCGHRGIPCRTEEKRVSRLLRKSGFIPMLENEGAN
mmetsp:Transcript_18098/g.30902  ORF Transcript_18098/g.30902 Transcript_18098/m.30902 type:complete len:208 (+) Transcript_18098:3038-3661(+)